MVRLAHAPHQPGEIVGHFTFSLEMGLVAKHFGMRSRPSSIIFGIQFCIQRRLTSSPYTSEAQV
jgi:hypothetical protein